MWLVYDKETKHLGSNKLTDSELMNLIKYIVDCEIDRAHFYEFENESGEKLTCWDVCRRFAMCVRVF